MCPTCASMHNRIHIFAKKSFKHQKNFIFSAKDKFTVGALDQTLVVNVTVENQGEDSYLTQYFVTVPPGYLLKLGQEMCVKIIKLSFLVLNMVVSKTTRLKYDFCQFGIVFLLIR